MKGRGFLVLLFLLSLPSGFSESRYENSPWRLHLELDQMLCLKFGAEYSLSPRWGIKGALGVPFFGLGHISYDLVGIHHFRPLESPFQLATEFGLPVAYFNALEGEVIDHDPVIDDPYYGWCPGVNLVWGWQFKAGTLGLKTGVLLLLEYQQDSGWRDPGVLPEVALEWAFHSR
jgi:hypothetical protein